MFLCSKPSNQVYVLPFSSFALFKGKQLIFQYFKKIGTNKTKSLRIYEDQSIILYGVPYYRTEI